jgi:tRNA threonylcarbamoyladenosine biosynthesis protein TsaE
MIIEVHNAEQTRRLGARIGASLKGGEVFELVGDVGAGKTTFTKGLAQGLGISDEVQSPSFTISRVYDGRDNLQLVHYDFYRLSDPGIMASEVAEMVQDPKTVTVIEWADIVEGVQMIILGVLGNYIGRIYTEVQNRPLYTVESIRKKRP